MVHGTILSLWLMTRLALKECHRQRLLVLCLRQPVFAAVSVAPRSAVITWQTNKVSDQQVFYGTTTTYGMSTLLDPNLEPESQSNLDQPTTRNDLPLSA